MNDETRPITAAAKDDTMTEHESESGRHPVNIGQLVMAVAFAGMLFIWTLWIADVVQGSDFNWLMPIPWLAAGAAGLFASVRPSRT